MVAKKQTKPKPGTIQLQNQTMQKQHQNKFNINPAQNKTNPQTKP